MAGADGVGVVVVVPAFATGEDGDPPVVAGVVAGFEAALAPEVGGGVDEPRGVEADDDAEEGSPEHHGEAAEEVVGEGPAEADLGEAGGDQREVVVFREPDVALVAGESRGRSGRGARFRSGGRVRERIQPAWAHQVPSWGVCGSPSWSEF